MGAKWSTEGRRYADRLIDLQTAWWKRILPVQAPYRWHLRRLRPGYTLDIGCGLGRNLAHLGGAGVGIDHNPELVAVARRRGFEAYTTEEFAAERLIRPAPFDSLLLSHVLEHMTPTEAVDMLVAYLVYLRPGGRVIAMTPQERGYAADPTHVTFASFVEVRNIFRSSGLRVERHYSFPFPRPIGKLFVYNEFVTIAVKP